MLSWRRRAADYQDRRCEHESGCRDALHYGNQLTNNLVDALNFRNGTGGNPSAQELAQYNRILMAGAEKVIGGLNAQDRMDRNPTRRAQVPDMQAAMQRASERQALIGWMEQARNGGPPGGVGMVGGPGMMSMDPMMAQMMMAQQMGMVDRMMAQQIGIMNPMMGQQTFMMDPMMA